MPVEPDALLTTRDDGGVTARDTPLGLDEVPIVRVLNAGLALVDQPPRPVPAGFAMDRLGAIPLLIDDVTRDKFTSHVPDLVRTDHETSPQYAPVVLTTNRDVSTIPPDLTKRMVTCHIDAAIPENRSVTERIARRAQKEIGTALYRAYLQRLMPEVRAMRADIDADTEHFPDLLARSSEVLRELPAEALGEAPAWAWPLSFAHYFRDPASALSRSACRYTGGCR